MRTAGAADGKMHEKGADAGGQFIPYFPILLEKSSALALRRNEAGDIRSRLSFAWMPLPAKDE